MKNTHDHPSAYMSLVVILMIGLGLLEWSGLFWHECQHCFGSSLARKAGYQGF
jgi:hypothetical protein